MRTEYYIRQVGYTTEIAKFVDGCNQPETVYRIRKGLSCNCQARTLNCKHKHMVKSGHHCFIDGEPIYLPWE